MAITCRVFEPESGKLEAVPGGYREERACVFLGDAGEIEGTDWSGFEVVFLHSDTLAAARSRLVTAAVAEGARLGYEVARSRVIFPDFARGS